MPTKRTIRLRVKVREFFPLTDPIVPHLLRVMAASNDVGTIMKLYLHSNLRVRKTDSERDTVNSESVYLFRLMCGTAYEAALVFLDFAYEVRSAEQAGQKDLVGTLKQKGRQAFLFLENVLGPTLAKFEKTEYGKILVQARNHAFHYDKAKSFQRALRAHDEIGDLLIGEIKGLSRYFLVDDLQAEIMFKPIAIDLKTLNSDIRTKSFLKTTGEMSSALTNLADAWIGRYLDKNPAALVEKIEDTVLLERLWNIQPEAS